MGYDVEGRQIFFRLSKHNSPQDAADEKAMGDVQAAVGALLADPLHGDLVTMEEGFVEAYRAVMADPVARGRVAYLLIQALARVRRGPERINGPHCGESTCLRDHTDLGRHA